MKCFKLVRYDLKNGLLRNAVFLLTPLCVAIICNQCRHLLAAWEQPCGWAIYLAYCFKGMQIIHRETLQSAFQIPVLWLLILVLPLAVTLNFPFRDIKTIGTQMLLRSKRRTEWWLCKCVWNLCCTAVYFAIVLLIITLFCLCNGSALSLATPMAPMMALFSESDITTAVEEMTTGQTVFYLIIMPFMALAAIDMLEMFLSLLFRPVCSFLFSVALVAASSFVTSPLLIGNYANLARCGAFIHGGLDGVTGFWICSGVVLFSVLAGSAVFHCRDILPDYKEL